jgi:hypothetical protein
MVNHSKFFNDKKYNEIIDLINKSDETHVEISTLMNLINKFTTFSKFILLIKEEIDKNIFKKFISICDIKYELFNSIIEIIKINKGNYKEDYCSEYKLILIFQMRNTINKWQDLTKSIFYDPKPNVKYHYKSIQSQYKRWCSDGIFKKAFHKCVPHNNDGELSGLKFKDDDDSFYIINDNNDLFIDSTSINNKYGSEGIVVNPELTKKNITKISTISNVNGFIYSISNIDNNIKMIKYNNENKEIKTTPNDVKTIQISLNNINPNIKIKSQVCTLDLIGDKGYIINKTFNYKENTVNVITPLKKNSRNKFIHKNNKKLSYRYIIENTICSYKKDNRINTRKDRKIKTFMGWVYISCLNHNLNINKRMIVNQ